MTPSFPCTATKSTSCACTSTAGGQPRSRGGRRNDPGSLLDQIKFIRISMLTDPALDAGRHEFELRTLLGRMLPPEQNLKFMAKTAGSPRSGRSIR
jgi:glutamate synthase (NADPH/NADH) large chain